MSRYFPHAAYAEDQPLSRTILITHVMYRGVQTGAVVGTATAGTTYLYKVARSRVPLRDAIRTGQVASTLGQVVRPTFSQTLYRHVNVGAVVGVAAMVVGLPIRMKGREEIEWKDRSWRLMENEGQLEVDDWSIGGSLVGAASSLLKSSGATGWKQFFGRTLTGNVVGIVGYLTYRYGFMKGKR